MYKVVVKRDGIIVYTKRFESLAAALDYSISIEKYFDDLKTSVVDD